MHLNSRPGIRPFQLAHIALRTDGAYDGMCQWYSDLLNAEILFKNEIACFMTYDDEHHRVAIVRARGAVERPVGTVGVEHHAFTYSSLSDLLETYERLKAQGILPILAINHGATTSIYYEDPDRNRIELQVDNFDGVAEFVDFLHSGVLAVNPVGVAFDPDQMLAQLRSGVPAKLLQAYPSPPGPVDGKVIERLVRN